MLESERGAEASAEPEIYSIGGIWKRGEMKAFILRHIEELRHSKDPDVQKNPEVTAVGNITWMIGMENLDKRLGRKWFAAMRSMPELNVIPVLHEYLE